MSEQNELFKKALAFVLKWEGGYSNNPNDKGGMTFKGITQTTYNSYLKSKNLQPKAIATEYKTGTVPKGLQFVHYKLTINKTVVKDVDVVVHITQKEIEEIYFQRYWIAAKCNTMTTKFAVLCFDTAVNMGVGVVKATGMTRNEEFLRAASYKYPDKYIEARAAKYREFAKNPSQRIFLNGWLNRLNSLKEFVHSL